MPETTPNFGLPMLHVGQAAKELTHNEALMLIDALLLGRVKAIAYDPLSLTAAPGDLWIVGSGASGDWSAMEDNLALKTDGGWRFIVPARFTRLFNEAEHCFVHFDAGWHLPAALPVLQPSTTEDEGARALLSALVIALESNGSVRVAG